MPHLRYLNRILTVLAVLLTVNLYVQLAGPARDTAPGWTAAQSAEAATKAKDPARGVGSNSARAQAQLDELKSINQSLNAFKGTLTSGGIHVVVDALPAAE